MIYINSESRKPIYMQIYECIKQEILNGDRKKGTKLPPIRELASSLDISKTTVENAYSQLMVEGYVTSRRGAGFLVEDIQKSLLSYRKISQKHSGQEKPKYIRNSNENMDSDSIQYDFQYGNITPEFFPSDYWRKTASDILKSYEATGLSAYVDKMGDIKLREALSIYLYEARGIKCHADQIVISSGFTHGMNIICDILAETHRKVGMEEPGFYSARDIFKYKGFKTEPLRVCSYEQYFQDLKCADVNCLYVTPSHQFPMGMVMPIDIRYRLLEWAVAHDGYLIEDDYDSTLRYNSRPIPALFSLDESERVFYIGTFSKSLSPAIRVNYLVLPEKFVEKYHSLPQYNHSTVSWLDQRILAKFIEDGEYHRHLRKISTQYKMRNLLLKQQLKDAFGNKITIHGSDAGLHIILEIETQSAANKLIDLARKNKVAVYSIKKCFTNTENIPKTFLLLGFGQVTEDDIKKGIRLLKDAWESEI